MEFMPAIGRLLILNLLQSMSENKSDQQFYTSLTKYKTLWYKGQGRPRLLLNDKWYESLYCLGFMNVLAAVLIILLIIRSVTAQQTATKQYPEPWVIIIIIIGTIILANISFVMTQLWNPGIVNPAKITEDEFQKDGKKYCDRCRAYVTRIMTHCGDCQICVEDLDHHCGFFNKCIAGPQRHFFNLTMFLGFIAFCTLIIGVGYLLT